MKRRQEYSQPSRESEKEISPDDHRLIELIAAWPNANESARHRGFFIVWRWLAKKRPERRLY